MARMKSWTWGRLALGMAVWALAGLAAASAGAAAPVAEAAPVAAAPPAPAAEAPAKPQEVRVGIYVLSMGKLDVTTGSFRYGPPPPAPGLRISALSVFLVT